MFDRFRHQYPLGSITSQLVQIHGDRYIVSVALANDNAILVSSLAADANIETAEARALTQAMHILGFSAPQPTATTPELPSPPELPHQIETIAATVNIMETIPAVESVETIAPLVQTAAEPEPPAIAEKPLTQVQEIPPAEKYQPAADRPTLSVTDMIPLINMELKRLNWSREKGRDCIITLYNKRSSSLLSDEELLGLLHYLQAQTAID